MKIASRKLFAWITSTAILCLLLFKLPEAVVPFLPYYGGITMIYIGFQAVVDFIPAILEVIKAWKGKNEEC
jgi:hypothetical protein